MRAFTPAACAALAVLFATASSQAATFAELKRSDPLPALFVQYFYRWKAEPKDLQVSELRVLNAGGQLRVLCGAYDLPGQARRPFLVLGDDAPSASAAWEPGSFPESDPLYPQLMQDLKLCQSMGDAVTASEWRERSAPKRAAPEA